MDTFYENYIERLQVLHRDMIKAIDGLSSEALDWSPGKDINSIDVLVTHVVGSERFWIGDVVMDEPSNRDRDSEFRARGASVESLKARLEQATAYARASLEKLSLQDLTASRQSIRDGKSYSVSYALLHALEHSGIHLGHMQIMRQLWDERK